MAPKPEVVDKNALACLVGLLRACGSDASIFDAVRSEIEATGDVDVLREAELRERRAVLLVGELGHAIL